MGDILSYNFNYYPYLHSGQGPVPDPEHGDVIVLAQATVTDHIATQEGAVADVLFSFDWAGVPVHPKSSNIGLFSLSPSATFMLDMIETI